MKTTQKSLGLLGLSIGLGSLFSLTPMDVVHAGIISFNRDITHNGQKMGHVEFTWDEENIKGNSIKSFDSLESFSFIDYGGTEYNLDFVYGEAFVRRFDFNLITNDLSTEAYKFDFDVPTNQIGFRLKSMGDSLVLASNPVNTHPTNSSRPHSLVPILSQSDVPIDNVFLEETPENNDTASVPENSLVTALLMIAGFVLIGSKKAF